MVVQPFDYQKRTNIEEHNQIVDKLNEVVDAVNNIDPSGQGLEPRVTALETDVTDLGVRVDSVESKNLQQDTAITDIRADAETTKNRLGTAEGNITTLTGKVTQLETDTTSLDGRVTDIDGRLTTLAGNYTTLGGRVDSLNTEVGQLTTEVGGLETGKVNVAQGIENNGKYLGIGADGNVTLKEIVIPQGKTYKLTPDRSTYNFNPVNPTDVTINGINYKRYYGAGSLPSLSNVVYSDIDIAKVVFDDTDAYCGSLYFMNYSSQGPNPNNKTMGDYGILYDILIFGRNAWYTILVPTDLYGTINMTKIYVTVGLIKLEEA